MSNDSTGGPARRGSGSGAPRDRRATHRAAIEIPAVLHVGTREIACAVRDLSAQGIALTLPESVAPGMLVRVAFRLPNSRQPVEVSGVLVRASGGRGDSVVGMQLVEPDADSVRVIETFVARNRSDRPFSSRRRDGPDSARIVVGESAASLKGIYRKAVDEVAAKDGGRRGLLSRWFRRGGS